MVAFMDMKKAVRLLLGLVALCVFLYPILKMTLSAIENSVNLYPVYMVIGSVILAFAISKFKN